MDDTRVHIVVTPDPSNAALNVTLDGVCGPGRLGVEKECVNQWYTRETHASFRLEVTSNGRVLSGYLYSERDLPGRKEGNMVKELSIFLKTARS